MPGAKKPRKKHIRVKLKAAEFLILLNKYMDGQISTREIAKEYNINHTTWGKWMDCLWQNHMCLEGLYFIDQDSIKEVIEERDAKNKNVKNG